ncbi:hypothetical protein [Amycolatopsis sp. NPDC051102]|uniref:hypothetical protein n=1 Tax=Amycolatopsis sp. NPDC051102 TaxID=3155163 RepID=UPI0034209B03
MDEVLNSPLRTAVLNRLDYLDSLARDPDEPSKAVCRHGNRPEARPLVTIESTPSKFLNELAATSSDRRQSGSVLR